MDSSMSSADLVAMFESELRLCRVMEGETVLIFTDPRFPHPEYPPAAFAAARSLGANVYVLTSQGDQSFDDPLVRAAWQSADMVLGMSTLPRGIGSWMYTQTHDLALQAGARVLMVQEPLQVLKRMLPNQDIRRRGLAGAQRLQRAQEIHVVSEAGSD
jgi:2,5-dihydroxypyridine 5,6-dioxygenase